MDKLEEAQAAEANTVENPKTKESKKKKPPKALPVSPSKYAVDDKVVAEVKVKEMVKSKLTGAIDPNNPENLIEELKQVIHEVKIISCFLEDGVWIYLVDYVYDSKEEDIFKIGYDRVLEEDVYCKI